VRNSHITVVAPTYYSRPTPSGWLSPRLSPRELFLKPLVLLFDVAPLVIYEYRGVDLRIVLSSLSRLTPA
jgi:hypothetical protein